MGETIERFPLFPLGLVLLPREVVPLHIFEDRYKQMVDECLGEDSDFGMLWMDERGLREVGCTAEITQLLARTEDGRMDILVQGVSPFQLVRRVGEMAYPAGDIQLLDEEHEEHGEQPRVNARQGYADLVEHVTGARPSETDLEQLDSYGMAATVALELDAKQELLELRSEHARLDRLCSLFAEAQKRYAYIQKAAERAKSNGKLRS